MEHVALWLVDFSGNDGDLWGIVGFGLLAVGLPVGVGLAWRYADRRRERRS